MCLANFDKALSSVSGHASDASAAICRKAVVAKHIRFQFPHHVSLCKPGMWHCATPLKMVGIQIDQLLLKLDINCAWGFAKLQNPVKSAIQTKILCNQHFDTFSPTKTCHLGMSKNTVGYPLPCPGSGNHVRKTKLQLDKPKLVILLLVPLTCPLWLVLYQCFCWWPHTPAAGPRTEARPRCWKLFGNSPQPKDDGSWNWPGICTPEILWPIWAELADMRANSFDTTHYIRMRVEFCKWHICGCLEGFCLLPRSWKDKET